MLADNLLTDQVAPTRSRPDPWQQALGLLFAQSDQPAGTPVSYQRCGRQDLAGVLIRIIDMPDSHTAVLSWNDATHCRYGEQQWGTAFARVAGFCAMSGRQIESGDAIYKPRPQRPRARNADAMILADVLLTQAEVAGVATR